jgi:transcription initiation factor TFIID subunit 8
MSGGGGSGSGTGTGDEFGRAVARAAVAQELEAAGFDCAHRSAVDAVVDVLLRYITHIGRSTAFNANLAGRALANKLDIIQALEEVGADMDGFAGASAAGRCLAGSGVVRDLMAFVDTKAEVPFVRPLPRFPVPRVQQQPSTIFAVIGREIGMKHVPEWLPVFPDPHTYVRTEAWVEPPATKERVDKVQQVRQRRKAEKSLLSLQQRLAQAGAEGFHLQLRLRRIARRRVRRYRQLGPREIRFLSQHCRLGRRMFLRLTCLLKTRNSLSLRHLRQLFKLQPPGRLMLGQGWIKTKGALFQKRGRQYTSRLDLVISQYHLL